MNKILSLLHLSVNPLNKVKIHLLIYSLTLMFVCFKLLVLSQIGAKYTILFHLTFWLIWFVWLGYFFPKRRQKHIKKYGKKAYKKAFYSDILIGVSFGVSQMIFPFFNGIIIEKTYNNYCMFLMSFLLIFSGLFLMYKGFCVLGFDKAGFIYEYIDDSSIKGEKLVCKGIYSKFRHPLFTGGIIASFGSSLLFSNTIILLGLINFLILPLYILLEEKRQRRIFGRSFIDYKEKTSNFFNIN